MRYVGVAQAQAEEELIERDAEEAEIGEGPIVSESWSVTSDPWKRKAIPRSARDDMFFVDGRIAEDREAAAEWGDGEHEESGGYDAEGRER